MTDYTLEISRSAEKTLKSLPRADQIRVATAILNLSADPFPRGSRKLSGYDDVFRIRAGVYRILYSVGQKKLIIIILKIGHRKEVYRGVQE
jgi:mRNA interferase RelE/StbE